MGSIGALKRNFPAVVSIREGDMTMEEQLERGNIAGLENKRRKLRGAACWLPLEPGKGKKTDSLLEPSQKNMSLLTP